jgi:hypothetical protein
MLQQRLGRWELTKIKTKMKTFKKSNRHLIKIFKIKNKTLDVHATIDKTEDKN